ncbi:ATP-dependent DNA ligase [Umbelopsis sp. PMI_123]|nr:ATP-dependent DNA ligase [Umbelopsis sp. PMI_123]
MPKGQKRKPNSTSTPSPRKKSSTTPQKGATPQKGLEFFFESQRKKQHELEQEAFGDPDFASPSSPLGNRSNAADEATLLEIPPADDEPLFLTSNSSIQGSLLATGAAIGETSNDSPKTRPLETVVPLTKTDESSTTNLKNEEKTITSSNTLLFQPKAEASDDNEALKQPLTTDPLNFDAQAYPVNSWMTPDGPVAPYSFITEAFCIIADTSARTIITNVLCNMLRVLMVHTPTDLLPAVWLCSNAIAPPYMGVELGIGPLILSKSINSVAGTSGKVLKSLYEKYGDWGDVAYSAKVSVRTLIQPKALTVRTVYSTLKSIANLKGQGTVDAKAALVKKLVLASRGEEVRYLVRTFVSHLRIGAVRTTVLTALAKACVLDHSPFCLIDENDPLIMQYHRQTGDDKAMIIDKMKRTERLIRECYAQHPNLDNIVPALLQGISQLRDHCPLSVGVPLRPMLGKITRDLSEVFVKLEGRSFACEYKYDGQRAQIHLGEQGHVKIFSRHLEDMTDKYPDVVALLSEMCKENTRSFIIDAEIVAMDDKGVIQPFSILSNRARKNVMIENITINVCVLAFDLMLLNNEPTLHLSFSERRQRLRDHFHLIENKFALVEAIDASGNQEYQDEVSDFFKKSIKDGCEGIMVKVLNHPSIGDNSSAQMDDKSNNDKTVTPTSKSSQLLSTYEPDKRMESWLKVKKDYVDGVSDSLDLVPIGAWWGNGRKVGWYSPILLACYNPENETFESVCKCISGFSDKFYKEMLEFYSVENDRVLSGPRHDYVVDHRPDVWFQACEVWEIKGADITVSPIHKGAIGRIDEARGLSLRFPRFVRKRDDKDVEDATSSETLAEMYEKQTNIHGASAIENGNLENDEGDEWIADE